jgi:hypothetical protein
MMSVPAVPVRTVVVRVWNVVADRVGVRTEVRGEVSGEVSAARSAALIVAPGAPQNAKASAVARC